MSQILNKNRLTLHLSSKDAIDKTSKSDFSLNLGQQFFGSNASHIALQSLEMPNSFYNINNTENNLYFQFQFGYLSAVGGQNVYYLQNTYNYNYELTSGNYSISTILTNIKNGVNNFLSGITNPGGNAWAELKNNNFDATYNSTTGKVSFSLANAINMPGSGAPSQQFPWVGWNMILRYDLSDNLANKLGFEGNINTFNTSNTGTQYINATKVLDIRPISTIYLRLLNIGTTSIQNGKVSNIIHKINNAADFGSVNNYRADNLDNELYPLTQGLSSILRIQLTNESNQVVEINSDWSFSLVVFFD